MSKVNGLVGGEARAAKGGLSKLGGAPHLPGMDDLRRMYAVMASRRPVRLRDGRTGLIARVDTDYPSSETILHVWITGDEVEKVRADEVDELDENAAAPPA